MNDTPKRPGKSSVTPKKGKADISLQTSLTENFYKKNFSLIGARVIKEENKAEKSARMQLLQNMQKLTHRKFIAKQSKVESTRLDSNNCYSENPNKFLPKRFQRNPRFALCFKSFGPSTPKDTEGDLINYSEEFQSSNRYSIMMPNTKTITPDMRITHNSNLSNLSNILNTTHHLNTQSNTQPFSLQSTLTQLQLQHTQPLALTQTQVQPQPLPAKPVLSNTTTLSAPLGVKPPDCSCTSSTNSPPHINSPQAKSKQHPNTTKNNGSFSFLISFLSHF